MVSPQMLPLSNPSEALPNRKGFTLVEVLAAIAIIALLVVISVPATKSVMAGGKRTQCVSHLKSWAYAFSSYAAENQGVLVAYQNDQPWASIATGAPYWRYFITDNLKQGQTVRLLRECPADSSKLPGYSFNKALQNKRVFAIEKPSKTIVLADSTPNRLYFLNSGGDWSSNVVPRHGNNANVLFIDGHVETLTKNDILDVWRENPVLP